MARNKTQPEVSGPKKLIYIDNDNEERAKEDLPRLQRHLRWYSRLPAEYLAGIQIVPNFAHLERNEALELLFNPNHVILSQSVYTATHYGSLMQIQSFLRSAATNSIHDQTFIDGHGELIKTLERDLDEWKYAYAIMQAIETNYILAIHEHKEIVRIRIELKGYRHSPLRLEPFHLAEHLGVEPELDISQI